MLTLGRIELQPQAHSSDRPTRSEVKCFLTFFYLKMFDYRIFIRWAGECTKMCISRPKKFWEGHYLLRLPLPNGVLPPQYGTHSLLAFALVLHHVLSVVFLKPLFRSGLQFPLAAHTSASDSAFGRRCIHYKALSTL